MLEDHFREYFSRAKAAILEGNRRFAFTLGLCYKLGQAKKPRNANALDDFLASLPQRR
jgi:hypothetical protein